MMSGPIVTLLLGLTVSLEVQGHRGARAVLPENTLVGFEYALKTGVDTIELDLGVTADDALVVAHDPYLNPDLCLGPRGERLKKRIPLRTLRLAEVKKFDCGSLKNARFPNQKPVPKTRIPTFDEVAVLAAKHGRIQLNVETKIVPGYPELTPTPERFAALVIDVLKKHRLINRSTLQSFDRRTLVAAKKRAPKLSIAQLTGENFPDLLAVAKASGADILSPNHHWITKREVKRLQAAKIRVIPWTVNDEKGWARLIDYGVDGIITDDPAALIAYLKKRKLR